MTETITDPKQERRMSSGQRILFFVTAWLIVLMPFLFWWNTWFGRKLSNTELNEYLHDDKKPRHMQHALVQLGERMSRHDATAAQWYPDVVRLAANPVEEVRNTDAWVMGQDTSGPGFHYALLKLLNDPSPMVRGNAALSLVRFGDASGRPQIVALLEPARIVAPGDGRLSDTSSVGTAIRQGGVVAKLQGHAGSVEIRSPITGRLSNLSATTGQTVTTGQPIAIVDPGSEQVWEALRALYLVGQTSDLSAILPYQRELPEIPTHVRQQAIDTANAIRQRGES